MIFCYLRILYYSIDYLSITQIHFSKKNLIIWNQNHISKMVTKMSSTFFLFFYFFLLHLIIKHLDLSVLEMLYESWKLVCTKTHQDKSFNKKKNINFSLTFPTLELVLPCEVGLYGTLLLVHHRVGLVELLTLKALWNIAVGWDDGDCMSGADTGFLKGGWVQVTVNYENAEYSHTCNVFSLFMKFGGPPKWEGGLTPKTPPPPHPTLLDPPLNLSDPWSILWRWERLNQWEETMWESNPGRQ